ncbi:NAD(P)-dependent oxidoreductase [Streptomyces sp. ODS28]|uniref:NAD-dependent epimerase/dehydratase family protein n=1 Tax=Streptomyces sp. ODS28 TaxID=3136688 RepID=UPI0031ED7BB4
MRVLVTGATGFVGSHLVRRLAQGGHQVGVLVRDPARLAADAPVDRVVRGDVASGAGLAEAVRDVECVFHLAAAVKAPSPAGYEQVNGQGTRRLLGALRHLPASPRLVYCSSLAAAGPSLDGRPRAECAPPAPVSHYGRSKLSGELALRAAAGWLDAVIVRPPIVYGPGDREFVPALRSMVAAGLLLTCGRGPRRYSLVHVGDLCRALHAAGEGTERLEGTRAGAGAGTGAARGDHASAGRGVYQVSDGEVHTYEGIGRELAHALGRRAPRTLPVPPALAQAAAWAGESAARALGRTTMLNRDKLREARQQDWTLAIDRAVRELRFTPLTGLREGLAGVLGAEGAQGAGAAPYRRRGPSRGR